MIGGKIFLKVRTGFGCLEKNLQTTNSVCEQNSHSNSTYSVAPHDHISSREHTWLESCKAQDCTSLCPDEQLSSTCHVPIPCRTWHCPQAQVLSHPSHPLLTFFQTVSPLHTSPVIFDPCLPCDVPRQSGRSTQTQIVWDQSHRDRSGRAWRPRAQKNWAWKKYWDRSVSNTGKFVRNSITEDVEEFGKLLQRRPTSSHRCIPIMTQRRALQTRIMKMANYEKLLASPLYTQSRGDCKPSRVPTAQGKLDAMVVQKREASAKRTQADHSRRESLTSNSSQAPSATVKLAAMFSSGNEEPGNQIKSSIFKNADPSNVGKISSWRQQRSFAQSDKIWTYETGTSSGISQ